MFPFPKLSAFLSLTLFLAIATGQSQSTTPIDAYTRCGQYDSVTAGPYSLLLNQWNMNTASSGSSCASLSSLNGTTIAWETTWTWVGGYQVKSYTNIQLNKGLNKQLSAISSMPTTWHWSQTNTDNILADVAYDLFTSNSPGGPNVNEIMIWLADFNSGPISASYTWDGRPVPVATNILLAGHSWDMCFGSNGANKVYSFFPSDGAPITKFSGDLNIFLEYLTSKQMISSSQYLKTAQGGTEATSGSATFTTLAYKLVINSHFKRAHWHTFPRKSSL